MKQSFKNIMSLVAIPIISLGCLPLRRIFETTGSDIMSLVLFLAPFLITPVISCIAVRSSRKQLCSKLFISVITLVTSIMSCFCFYWLLYRQFPDIDLAIRNRLIVSSIFINSISIFSTLVMDLCTSSSLYKKCLPRMIMIGLYAVVATIASFLPYLTDIVHHSIDEQTIVIIGLMILLPLTGTLCINKIFRVYDEKHRILWVSAFGAYVAAIQTLCVACILDFQYPLSIIVISLSLCLPQLMVIIWITFHKVLNHLHEQKSQ